MHLKKKANIFLFIFVILLHFYNFFSYVNVNDAPLKDIDVVLGSDAEKYFNAGVYIAEEFLNKDKVSTYPSIKSMYYSFSGTEHILTGRSFTYPLYLAASFIPFLVIGLDSELYLVGFSSLFLLILLYLATLLFEKEFKLKNLTLILSLFLLLPSVQSQLLNTLLEIFNCLLIVLFSVFCKRYLNGNRHILNNSLLIIFTLLIALNHKLALYATFLFVFVLIYHSKKSTSTYWIPIIILFSIIGLNHLLTSNGYLSFYDNHKGWGHGGFYTAYTGLYLPESLEDGYCCTFLSAESEHPTYYLNGSLINGNCEDVKTTLLSKNNNHYSNVFLLEKLNIKLASGDNSSPCFSNYEITEIFISQYFTVNNFKVMIKKFAFTYFVGCKYFDFKSDNLLLNNLSKCGDFEYFKNFNLTKILINLYETSFRFFSLIFGFIVILKSKHQYLQYPYIITYFLLIPSITTAESRYFLHFLLVLAFLSTKFLLSPSRRSTNI